MSKPTITYTPGSLIKDINIFEDGPDSRVLNNEEIGVGVVGMAMANVLGMEITDAQAKALIARLRKSRVIMKFKSLPNPLFVRNSRARLRFEKSRGRKVSINGVIYDHVSHAARHLPISHRTITNYLKSDKEEHKEWFYVKE